MSLLSKPRVGAGRDASARPFARSRRRGTVLRRRRLQRAGAGAAAALLLGGFLLTLPGNASSLKPDDGRNIVTVMRWARHTAHVTYLDLAYETKRGAALYRHRDLMTNADFESARDGVRQRIKNDRWLLARAGAALTTITGIRDEWFHDFGGSADSPILGPSRLDANQLAAYAKDVGGNIRTTVPILDVARMFIEEGELEGVRGDVAFAQAIKETGDFSSPDVLIDNFAGLGHCSACGKGDGFATARDGVRAQIQLLRWLADPTIHSLADFASQPATLPVKFTHNGHSRATWHSLGGLWAPNPQYGDSIYGLFLRMYQASQAPVRHSRR